MEDKAIIECCKDIGNGDQWDIVTGRLNANIFETDDVHGAVDEVLKRGGSIRILTGPLDPKTGRFRDYFENEHVQVFQVDRRPQIHFRVGSKKVSGEMREPFKVCEELPHTKNQDNGYRVIKSKKIASGYEAWFEALIRDSRKCESQEDLVILGDP